ncbi:MAG: FAD-dependent oxidoreductase [Pseudomonadota bacterium]
MESKLNKKGLFLTDAQLKTEIIKCEYCKEKGCQEKCPVDCSPFEFIMAAKMGNPSDYKRAAGLIYKNNPLGGICGQTCPDTHCMSGCSRKDFDCSVNIPAVQATIVQKAKELGVMPEFKQAQKLDKKVAVIGAGPAGLGAATYLVQKGFTVDVYEKNEKAGGACWLIPDHRLDKEVLNSDINFWKSIDGFNIKNAANVENEDSLLSEYDAVINSCGLHVPIKPGVPGEAEAFYGNAFLTKKPSVSGNVAVYGGGAIAIDCATEAKRLGAKNVELFFLESYAEMPLTNAERAELLEFNIELNQRTKIKEIISAEGKVAAIKTVKVGLKEGTTFALENIIEKSGTEISRIDFDYIIMAIGNRSEFSKQEKPGLFYAGDMFTGPATVVEAVASGKNAGMQVEAFLKGLDKPEIKDHKRSNAELVGFNKLPVSLETDFFGRKIISPFLLSAAPPSDGYEQMKKAYEAGWAGGIMKTSFSAGPIHIPERYMHVFDEKTYGNCDNVSGHLLNRVTEEIQMLVKEYPDRLTMGSTGGPVTGNDESDKAGWQGNTKRLEEAGAMGIEYSLSCPQGGDGTEGDIVSQNAALTQKIVDWVMEVSDPEVPKFFKLTGAVTSIAVIVKAIKEVFDRYPNKKAGITLANTFPVMDFRPGTKKSWDEGILFGMSGEGVLPISYLSLASVQNLGVAISGNGGPMDYKAAANFLSLGVKNVQFCTLPTKYGYGVIDEISSGLSYLMATRGINSIAELINISKKENGPITGFMELSPVKKISQVNDELCEHCGNCSRCPYLAIELNDDKIPVTDATKCIGCGICALKCFSGSLHLRERTEEELKVLKED